MTQPSADEIYGRRAKVNSVIKHSLCSGVCAVPQWIVLSMAGLLTGALFFLPFSTATLHIVFVAMSIALGLLFALFSWILQRHQCKRPPRDSELINRSATEVEGTQPRRLSGGSEGREFNAASSEGELEAHCFFESGSHWCLEALAIVELLVLGALVLLAPLVVRMDVEGKSLVPSDAREDPSELAYPVEAAWKVFLLHLWFTFAVSMKCAASFSVGLIHFIVLTASFKKPGTIPVLLLAASFIIPVILFLVITARTALQLRKLPKHTHHVGCDDVAGKELSRGGDEFNRSSNATTGLSTGETETLPSQSSCGIFRPPPGHRSAEFGEPGSSGDSSPCHCEVVAKEELGRQNQPKWSPCGLQCSWNIPRGLLDDTRIPFVALDTTTGCIECASAGFAENVGMPVARLTGREFGGLLSELHVENAATVLDVVRTVASSTVSKPRAIHTEGNGKEVSGVRRTVFGKFGIRPLFSKQRQVGPLSALVADADKSSMEIEMNFPHIAKDSSGRRVLVRGCRFQDEMDTHSSKSLAAVVDEAKTRGTGTSSSGIERERPMVSEPNSVTGIKPSHFFSLSLDVYLYQHHDTCNSRYLVLRQPSLHYALDCVPLPCFLVHPQTGHVLHWNEAAERETGLSAYDMVGWPVCLTSVVDPTGSLGVFKDAQKKHSLMPFNSAPSAVLHPPLASPPLLVSLHLVAGGGVEAEQGPLLDQIDCLCWPGRHLRDVGECRGYAETDGSVLKDTSACFSSDGDSEEAGGMLPPLNPASVNLEPLDDYISRKALFLPPAWMPESLTESKANTVTWDALHVPLLFLIHGEAPGVRECSPLADCCQPKKQRENNGGVEGLSQSFVDIVEEFKESLSCALVKECGISSLPLRDGKETLPNPDITQYLGELRELFTCLAQKVDSFRECRGVPMSGRGDICGDFSDAEDGDTSSAVRGGRRPVTAFGSSLDLGRGVTTARYVGDGSRGIKEGNDIFGEEGARKGIKEQQQGTRYDAPAAGVLALAHKNTASHPVSSFAVSQDALVTPPARGAALVDLGNLTRPSGEERFVERGPGSGASKRCDTHRIPPMQPHSKPLGYSNPAAEIPSRSVTPTSPLRLDHCESPGDLPVWAMLKSNDEATVPSCFIRVPFGEVFRFGRSSKCHATTSDVFVSSVQFTVSRWVPAQLCAIRSSTPPHQDNGSSCGSCSPTPSGYGPCNSSALADWRVELCDCSINGTYVNVKRIGKGRTCTLRNNDLITFQLRARRFFLGFRFVLTDERGVPLKECSSPTCSSFRASGISGRGTPRLWQRTLSGSGSTFALNASQTESAKLNCSDSASQAVRSASGVRHGARTPNARRIHTSQRGSGRHQRGTIEWKIGEEMLGKGGNAEVYLGMNLTNGKLIAVKRVPLPKEAGGGGNGKGLLKRYMSLQEEIKVLSKAVHQNIVQYYGSSQNKDYFNILLEFVPGGSLRHLLENFGALSPGVICSYLAQTLEGLRYLHENDIVHSDVKAANILVTDKGRVKLSDFGTAKHLLWQQGQSIDLANISGAAERTADDAACSTHHVAGTLRWMAPELIRASIGPTKASDIWSVGCALIEMLSGDAPWNEYEIESEEEIINLLKYTTEPPDVPECQVLPELALIAKKCLALSPRDRPTCEELLQLVEEAREKLGLQEDETQSRCDDSTSLRLSSVLGNAAVEGN